MATKRRKSAAAAAALDMQLGEVEYPREQEIALSIAAVIEDFVRRRDAEGPLRRDVHPKAHGCLKAKFRINADLPASLHTDIFQPAAVYDAWVRYSNSAPEPADDHRRDARGMAIKLLGPDGERIRADADYPLAQDFILINHPVFFINDPADYLTFMRRTLSASLVDKALIPLALGVRGSAIVLATAAKPLLPLARTRFWSTVPYTWGKGAKRQAIKYSVRLLDDAAAIPPLGDGADALRDGLREILDKRAIVLDFAVQQRASHAHSIEDVMTEWPEDEMPFQSVARLTIPRQRFDTSARDARGEAMAFNPWHCSPSHRPLGAINRLRLTIYERIAALRRAGGKKRRRSRRPE
ncbi:catalase [Tahibacter aquaticus]|uniref:Catalase n=1 Tax=Tahibacter aquaticus TaxID=520092 RepID=A0A4R6YGT8_9GAMM|nr:catalase [Tahibacter aquaticus]TDR35816.1 catalase [Tahibacter aquaticus]